jgi:hypothetical protein
MATLNLGRIKPVFRGAYAGGTAYVVDDIVTSGNETFICILASTGNATSNATYWTKLAAKGTDGTDVGTTITTEGDILFRDGSGLQRLAKGTAAQTLQMNGGATAPSWVTVAPPTADWVRLGGGTSSGMVAAYSIDSLFTADYDIYKIFVNRIFGSSGGQSLRYRYNSSTGTPQTGSNYKGVFDGSYWNYTGSSAQQHGGDWNRDYFGFSNVSTNQDEFGDMDITLFNPVSASIKTSSIVTGGGFEGNHIYTRHQRGIYGVSEAHTGITVYASSGNITVPQCHVYGLKNS